MNEAKRIFSNRQRLLTVLCIPLVCLILFFWQKCDGKFVDLFAQAQEYRELIAQYADAPLDEIIETFDARCETDCEEQLLEQAKYLAEYPSYLTRVQEQAAKLQLSSLFGGDPNSFTYRNIQKTAEDFEGITADGVKLGNDRAVRFWLSFSLADWFFLGAILILVMAFLEERQKGLAAIIRTCPGGREQLQFSRLMVLLAYSAAMALMLYGLPLALSLAIDGGWDDLSRPLQSLAEFQKCTANLSISQFLILFFLVKTASGFLLGVLIWFALSFLARPQMGWLATAAGLVAEYLLYTLIPAQSIFSPFREINVFSYVFTFGLYTQYTNINFFGYPVGRRVLLLGLLILAAVVLSCAAILILTRRYPFGNQDVLGKWIDRWNRAGDALRKRLGLYGFEIYKYLFLGAGGLFLILGFLMTQNLICGTTAYLQGEDSIYRQYVTEIQGPITQDTYDYLASARAALENTDMDTTDYEIALDRVEETIQNLEDGAWLVYEPLFMNCYGLKSSVSQRQNALLAYIFLIACLSPLYACEQSGDVRKVLRSTSGGRQKLFWTKYAVALTVTLIVWLRVLCEEWRLSVNYMGQVIASAPSSSISLIQGFPTTVNGTLALLYLFKLVSLLIPTHLCIFIGERCQSFEKAFLLSGLLLLIPAAAYYFGADALAFLTPASFLADSSPIFYGTDTIPLFAGWMVFSILALLSAKRRWCRT